MTHRPGFSEDTYRELRRMRQPDEDAVEDVVSRLLDEVQTESEDD